MSRRVFKRKAVAQRFHAKKRALQRYGVNLPTTAQAAIVKLIQKGQARWLKTQSNRVTHWAVEWEGKILPVVYDKLRKQLVTVLPPEALECEPSIGE